MNIIKRFGNNIAQKSMSVVAYIRRHPMETIELLSAAVLLMFSIYLIVPLEFLGNISTAYHYSWLRSLFGLLTGLPAIRLLYLKLTSSTDEYIYYRQNNRRKALFWMSFTWFYMSVLRLLTIAALPPLFLTFLLISLVTMVCYIRLGG